MSEGFKLSLSIIQSMAKKLNFSIVFLDLVSFSNLFNNLVRWLRKSSFMHTLLIAESLHSAKIFEKSRNLRIIAITLPNKSDIYGFSDFRLSKWNVVSPWIWFEFLCFSHILNWFYILSRYLRYLFSNLYSKAKPIWFSGRDIEMHTFTVPNLHFLSQYF